MDKGIGQQSKDTPHPQLPMFLGIHKNIIALFGQGVKLWLNKYTTYFFPNVCQL